MYIIKRISPMMAGWWARVVQVDFGVGLQEGP